MKRAFLGIGVVLAVLLRVPGQALAQWRGYDWGMGPMGPAAGGYGIGWFWTVLIFASWFAVMVVLFLLIRLLSLHIGAKGRPPRAEESPLDILKRRYAAGEIGKEEFEQKKKNLGV
jgi:putative membrane protein